VPFEHGQLAALAERRTDGGPADLESRWQRWLAVELALPAAGA
jgi:hypothetical protein